jgi:IS5 family transposase
MAANDCFRAHLGTTIVSVRHPLVVLAARMPWSQIEASLAPTFAYRDREERAVEVADLLGPGLAVAGADVSNAGRARPPICLMSALRYLKQAYNESDQVKRWAQHAYFQSVSGQDYFESRQPCDPAQISHFCREMGEAVVEQPLKTTIDAAVAMRAIKKSEFQRVIADTTVQSKAIAGLRREPAAGGGSERVARLAKRTGINLKQPRKHEGKTLRRVAGGDAHAKQFKRLRSVLKRQRTILGRLLRGVRRQMVRPADTKRAGNSTHGCSVPSASTASGPRT